MAAKSNLGGETFISVSGTGLWKQRSETRSKMRHFVLKMKTAIRKAALTAARSSSRLLRVPLLAAFRLQRKQSFKVRPWSRSAGEQQRCVPSTTAQAAVVERIQ